MTFDNAFTSQILESGAAGYAGMAASLLAEREPALLGRYGTDAVPRWKQQLQQWVLELAAAVRVDEPALFHSRVHWARKAFLAREVPQEDLRKSIEALRDILAEHLPGKDGTAVTAILDASVTAGEGEAGEPGSVLDATSPHGVLALRYLEHLLGGKPRAAIDHIMDAVDDGLSVRDAYLGVVVPALQEVGRLWHDARLSIAEEHIVTLTSRRVMTLLCERGQSTSPVERTVVTAAVAGNAHDVGVRVIADFFEMAGWRAVCLGPDVPADEIVKAAQFLDADLVVLSAMLTTHLRAMEDAVAGLRADSSRRRHVLVGGQAMAATPDLWKKLGADGSAFSVEEVVALGSRLAGIQP